MPKNKKQKKKKRHNLKKRKKQKMMKILLTSRKITSLKKIVQLKVLIWDHITNYQIEKKCLIENDKKKSSINRKQKMTRKMTEVIDR